MYVTIHTNFVTFKRITMSGFNHDWSYFKRGLFINAPVQKVFDAWIYSEQVETWFLKTCKYFDSSGKERAKKEALQTGDTYEWHWHNWDGSQKGSVTNVNHANHILEFGFIDNTNPCRVEVKEWHGKTLLMLTQSNIPTDDKNKREVHEGCSSGWSFWIVNLKSWLEGGVLLHETEAIPGTEAFKHMEIINI